MLAFYFRRQTLNFGTIFLVFFLTISTVPLIGCRQKPAKLPEILDEVLGEEVILEITPQAERIDLTGIKGTATVDLFGGEIQVTVSLSDAIGLPERTAMEVWLVDVGTSEPSQSSVSETDEKSGLGFGNVLSLGILKEEKGKWMRRSKFSGEFTPSDLVIVTLESDESVEHHDPRPETVLLIGEIKGEDLEEDFQ
jgi:hypothetical protein